MHFCAALLISAFLGAPWPRHLDVQIALALVGFAGFIYSLDVLRGVPKIKNYTMVLAHWVWHVLFPLLAYGVTVGAALSLEYQTVFSLFLVGGGSKKRRANSPYGGSIARQREL